MSNTGSDHLPSASAESSAGWRVNGSETGAPRVWVEDAKGKRVCSVPPSEHDLDTAHLIAAAPALLAALRRAERCISGYTESSKRECRLDEIRAAIAKATGSAS